MFKNIFKIFIILFVIILNACGGGGGDNNSGVPKTNPTNVVVNLKCSSVVTQLCSKFSNYTLYVKESNTLVKTVSLALNSSTTISNLKPNTNYHIYSNGIADAKDNIFAKVLDTYFKTGNTIDLVIEKLTNVNSYQVNFNVTTSDLAIITTKINYALSTNNQYSYYNSYDITNGDNFFYFAVNDSGYFTINDVTGYNTSIKSGSISESVSYYNIVFNSVTPSSSKVKNWPNYLAMGAVGGSNNNSFSNVYVDSVFKYGGDDGSGDQGSIVPPKNVYNMYKDFNSIATNNKLPINITMVEYTAEYSTNVNNVTEFTNKSTTTPSNIMLKHFISLGLDSIALNKNPIVLDNKKYYGSIIMNPDLIGTIQQQGNVGNINTTLQDSDNNLNLALRQVTCFLTRNYVQYDNESIQYIGSAYDFFESRFKISYDDGIKDWESIMPNILQSCIANPSYDTSKYNVPNFEFNNFNSWVQANNWIIRTFGENHISFGWQDNMWAAGNGSWLNSNSDLTDNDIKASYVDKLLSWIKTNIPAVYESGVYKPDFFVFDRYERDDSFYYYKTQATLYNDHSWNNYIAAVKNVSNGLNSIPIMLWQIPGAHILRNTEPVPTKYNSIDNINYPIFGVAANYFFGDTSLEPNLSNVNSVVANFSLDSDWSSKYEFLGSYTNYLTTSNYKWAEGKDSGGVSGLQKLVQANVFAILWGGGDSTNVIQNFNNPTDNGFLQSAVNNYNNPLNPKRVNLLP